MDDLTLDLIAVAKAYRAMLVSEYVVKGVDMSAGELVRVNEVLSRLQPIHPASENPQPASPK
jgi:hypothetical protein